MTQNPLQSTVALNPSNQATSLRVDSNTALKNISSLVADATVTTVSAATQVKSGSCVMVALNNLNLSGFTASVTTTSIGALYDVSVATAGTALNTTQIAALTTTSLVGFAVQNVGQLRYETPIKNGLVFVPGSGQVAALITK